jgi:SnoaL-like domain
MDFSLLLDRFARAIEQRDADSLAELFTDDGVYDDYFFGAATPGRAGISATVDHFYEGGTNYRWAFFAPLASASLGYASYWFSYDSTLPEANGARVVFEGMSRFDLEAGRIKRYSEVFDRGMALAQVGFAPERLQKIGLRYARALKALPAIAPHLVSDGLAPSAG